MTAAQRARQQAAKAQAQARQKAYEQEQGNKIAQYASQYAAGKVDANGKAIAQTAATTAAAQPVDAEYEAQKLAAQRNIAVSAAESDYQTGQTAYNSGYNADGSVNSANPYSQAQQYMDSWKRSVTGTNNSSAAAGQLYSGSRLNAQGRNDREYSVASDALKRSTQDKYHQIGVAQLQTYGQNATGGTSAQYEALRRSVYGS